MNRRAGLALRFASAFTQWQLFEQTIHEAGRNDSFRGNPDVCGRRHADFDHPYSPFQP
jgi:hypothetical protein